MKLLPLFVLFALASCGHKQEPIAVNSYCEIKGTERLDMRDPNLQGLWPVNLGRVLTGEDNYIKFCGPQNGSGKKPGPI